MLVITHPLSNNLRSTPGNNPQAADRRSDFDVTNTVQVCSAIAVRQAIQALFHETFPRFSFDPLWLAFHDFEELYGGKLRGYRGCDTVYHDAQHSLDVTLAMARLLCGYEKSCTDEDKLGAERAMMGIAVALFHDAGYIRRLDEPRRDNGAEFTIWHVSRSAEFIRAQLPSLGLQDWLNVASRIVHFTGYEINVDDIELDDPRDTMIGHFLGTADLLAQMADRCYLEKCRDRLYYEFVLGGIAVSEDRSGTTDILYGSGIDLLRKTPGFYRDMAIERLNKKFNRAYRFMEVLYNGRNPYVEFIDQNQRYLNRVIESEDWGALRRKPPCYTVLANPIESVSALVSQRLADLHAPAGALTSSH